MVEKSLEKRSDFKISFFLFYFVVETTLESCRSKMEDEETEEEKQKSLLYLIVMLGYKLLRK